MFQQRTLRAGVIATATMSLGLLSSTAQAHPMTFHATGPRAATTAETVNVLYSFSGPDGANPLGGLQYVVTPSGKTLKTTIFGITQGGGTNSDGTIFAQSTQGSFPFTSVFSFNGTNGAAPAGGLAGTVPDYSVSGPFVGVASTGGKYGYGAIYEATSNGAQSVLYSFTGAADGATPTGRLVYAGGAYYGTTSAGALGFGTVFKYSARGLQTLHEFTGGNDGGAPLAGLSLRITIPSSAAAARAKALVGHTVEPQLAPAQYVDSSLYGTTSTGGANGANGTIFKISTSGHVTTLFTFTDSTTAPGATPSAELSTDFSGNLYGTTTNGGSAGIGEVFEYSAAGKFSVLHDFAVDPTSGIATTGANPLGALTVAFNGNLYGTTSSGSANSLGNVFKISSSGFSLKYEFSGPDGASPEGKLIDGLNGYLYGTTANGGANGEGEIFAISE